MSSLQKGYKLTEVGVIPDNWEVTLLDSVAKRGSGHTPDKKHPEYWDGNIKWISLKDSDSLDDLYIYDTAEKITPLGIANSSAVIHPMGAVVLSRDAGVGKSAITKDVMAVSQHFMAWQCSQQLENHFLYYWLQSNKSEFERIAIGSTIKTIGLSYFKKLKIPLPPLREQKTIALSLSDTDALITACDRAIGKKRNIKQGTMQQLLTGKKRLPGFSGDWEVKELKSVIKLTNGFAFKSEFFSENGPIILTPGNFKLEGGLYFNEKNTKRYSGNFPSSARFDYGDLLVVMTDLTKECNLLGKPAFINSQDKILHNQRIGKVEILNRQASKEFLFYFFLSNQYHLKIKESATGSTVRHTSPKSIYTIPISLPPLPEQKAIAQILSDMDAEIAALEKKRDKYKAIKQGMMQELLTGKTRLKDNADK